MQPDLRAQPARGCNTGSNPVGGATKSKGTLPAIHLGENWRPAFVPEMTRFRGTSMFRTTAAIEGPQTRQ
jgi:hypothetical protein